MTSHMIPPHIMEILRQRRGYEPQDTLEDSKIRKMTPMDRFREVCAWHLGCGNDDDIIAWLHDCGLEVKERDPDPGLQVVVREDRPDLEAQMNNHTPDPCDKSWMTRTTSHVIPDREENPIAYACYMTAAQCALRACQWRKMDAALKMAKDHDLGLEVVHHFIGLANDMPEIKPVEGRDYIVIEED